MPDSEVIARKCKFPVGRAIINAAAIVLVWSVLLGCIFGSGLVQNQSGGIAAACIVLLSFVTLSDCAIFIYSYTKWKALPEVLIIFSNGKLIMPGRTAELSQIVYVSDSGGKTAGGIVFSFKDGGICTVGFINDAQSASKRINELILLTAPSDSGVRERSSREVLGVKAKSGRYNILVACARLPRELLVRQGDKLVYPEGSCNISDIVRINYVGYPQTGIYKTGFLSVELGDGRVIKGKYYNRPWEVNERLKQIYKEYNEKN